MIDWKSGCELGGETVQQLGVVGGEVEGIAFRRILKMLGSLVGIQSSAYFSDQILPLRPRHHLREFLQFCYKPRLLLPFLLPKKIAMALIIVPPQAEPPETAASGGSRRLIIVVVAAGWGEDRCSLRPAGHGNIYEVWKELLNLQFYLSFKFRIYII